MACKDLRIEIIDLYGGTRHSSVKALRDRFTPDQIKKGTMHHKRKTFECYFQIEIEDSRKIYEGTQSGKRWERLSLLKRGPVDTVFALALIHHLAISNNLPLNKIAEFFSRICDTLVIEFVPKHDSQVQRMLATREDIFPSYSQKCFEIEFGNYFIIRESAALQESDRSIYLMQKR